MTNPTIPSLRIHLFDVTELSDPSSTRHQESGSFAYVKTLGLGINNALILDNMSLDLSMGEILASSNVAAINFVAPNINQITEVTAINNFRFWLPAISGTAINSPFSYLQFAASGAWIPNPSFPSGAGSIVPSTLPISPNVARIDGETYINGYSAAQSSQYIYIRLFLSQDFPTGTFGVGGSGVFRPILSYDFY